VANLAPHARAGVLVLAEQIARGELLAATAARAAQRRSGHAIDFTPLLDGPGRIAAIPDPVQRFAVEHSLPDWLAAAFLAEFGAAAPAVAAALLAPAPRTIRCNPLRVGSRDELAEALRTMGVDTRTAAFAPFALHVDGDVDLFALPAYAAGAFEQQDEASQLAVLAVAPPPRGRVLDLCAGNGGKTLGLAAALQNRGEVLATDVHEGRLQALRQRARRAGATNVRALPVLEHGWSEAVERFARTADRILIDAPCSGTGSWRRRPEGRWLLEPGDLTALQRAQDELLERATAALAPGARVVYATCSLFADENERRVEQLLQRRPDLEIVPIADATGTFLTVRPDRHGCDGFFAAIVRKRR
jgi:16S rRNA (cytosine967-C5)-methyltransferase